MKRWLILVATVVALAWTVWAVHAWSVRERAREGRALADDACRRHDFLAGYTHLQSYLAIRAEDAEAQLLAAQCARRAAFLETYTGPHPELLEAVSRHQDAAERLGAPPPAVALERLLSEAQHGEPSANKGFLLKRAQAAEADAPLILEALTHCYLRNLQLEEALLCVERLLTVRPDHVLGLLWRGRIRDELKKVPSGREDYEQALKVVSDFDPARYYLAESLLRSNQARDAQAHLKVLIDRDVGNSLVRLAWAECWAALGNDPLGQELLDAWLAETPRKHPRRGHALVARARLALAMNQPAQAESFARSALQEMPLDRYALYVLARSLNAQQRGEEAGAVEKQLEAIKRDLRLVAKCRQELTGAPADVPLRYEIGAAYFRVGRDAEALVWLKSVLARNPKHRPTLQSLADYHAKVGDKETAAQLRRRLAERP
jgi:tetratricopeptide (TPR) repeat protein